MVSVFRRVDCFSNIISDRVKHAIGRELKGKLLDLENSIVRGLSDYPRSGFDRVSGHPMKKHKFDRQNEILSY